MVRHISHEVEHPGRFDQIQIPQVFDDSARQFLNPYNYDCTKSSMHSRHLDNAPAESARFGSGMAEYA